MPPGGPSGPWEARRCACAPGGSAAGDEEGDDASEPGKNRRRARDAARKRKEYAVGTELVLWKHAGEGQESESIVCTIEEQLGRGATATVYRVSYAGMTGALKVFEAWENHPFETMRKAGVKVTLNSDDPPHFGSSIGHEYAMAAKTWGYDAAMLKSFTRTAIEAAFVDEPTREKLLGQLG